jgi:hypothetical protein
MKGRLQDTIGSQVASSVQGLQNRFDTQNVAGLGSGVQQALMMNAAMQGAGALAQGNANIDIQNALTANQQQQFALGMAPSMVGAEEALPAAAQLNAQLATAGFSEAYNMSNQTGMGQQAIGGLIGAGEMALTGAVGGMLPGGAGMMSGLMGGLKGGLAGFGGMGGGGGPTGIMPMPAVG